MQWHEEILRDLAEQLDAARQLVRTNIEHDLRDQNASSESIGDSLAGVDALFDQRFQRALEVFVSALTADLRDVDETQH